ncbi:MAG: zinc ABC transporter substrate-binding protein [Microthrixaceae bacterium]
MATTRGDPNHRGATRAPRVLTATTSADGSIDDPHVWYDPSVPAKVGDALGRALVQHSPGTREVVERGITRWTRLQRRFAARVRAARAAVDGSEVVSSEPVARYLLDAVGLRDVTPAAYATATANESEPSPSAVRATTRILEAGIPRALVLNRQSEGASTGHLVAAAKAGGVAVVSVTEGPPANAAFYEWMSSELRDLVGAVKRGDDA